MATTKTIQPTGETITIPAMTDRPDASVFSTDVSRITDAVNSQNQSLEKLQTATTIPSNTNIKDYCDSLSVGTYWAVLGSSSTALNQGGPVANATILFISKYASEHIQIIAVPFQRDNYTMYILKKYGGTWGSNWIELARDKFKVGDTFSFNGAQVLIRSLTDKSGLYFNYRLPKECESNVTSFTVNLTNNSSIWSSSGNIGLISQSSQASNISLRNNKVLTFSLPTTGTIPDNNLFGVCELNATITFT